MAVKLIGAADLSTALADLAKAGDRGARSGVVKGSTKLVGLTREQISGEPRWSRRGAGKTGPAFDWINVGRPVHVPRSGGPGVLTGNLRRNVHALRPRKSLGGWDGKVSAMGGKGATGAQNVYAGITEARFPFMAPALVKFDTLAPAIFEAAWAEAIGKVK